MKFANIVKSFRFITEDAENQYVFLWFDYDVDKVIPKEIYIHEVSYPSFYTVRKETWMTLGRMRSLVHNVIWMNEVKDNEYEVKGITRQVYVIRRKEDGGSQR